MGEGEGVCGVVVSIGGYVILGNIVTINVTKCIVNLVTNFITGYDDSLKLQICKLVTNFITEFGDSLKKPPFYHKICH